MKIGNVNNASQINVSVPKGDHVTKTTNTSGNNTPQVDTNVNHKVEIEESAKIATQTAADAHDGKAAEEIQSEEVEDDVLQQAVKQANQTLKMYDRKIERSVHEVTHNIIYTLKDTKTNEVIKEFPPRKIQDMIAKMWELAGLVIDDRA